LIERRLRASFAPGHLLAVILTIGMDACGDKSTLLYTYWSWLI